MGQNGKSTFGDDLRSAREKQGLGVEQVSQATKLSVRHIRALEAGEFAELPGGVFRRGFVRSYLSAVGLSEADWLSRFDQVCRDSGMGASAETDWTTFAENVKNSRTGSPARAAKRTGAVILAVAVAVGAWCAFRWITHQQVLPPTHIRVNRPSWFRKPSLWKTAP